MRRSRFAVRASMLSWRTQWASRRSISSEAGDTLLEILIAVVIIGIASVALLGTLVTSVTTSAEHRSVSTLDSVLKSFAEAAKYEIQDQPNVFMNCASNYSVVTSPNPATGSGGVVANGIAGTPITVFATGLTPGTNVLKVFLGVGATYQATIISPNVVPASGNVTVTFDVPEIASAGQGIPEPVTVQDGATQVAASTNFDLVDSVGSPNPNSNTTVGESVQIPVSGFSPGTALTLTIGSSPTFTLNTGNGGITSGGTTDATGSSLVTFKVPALAATKTGYPISVTDGTFSQSSSSNLYVGYVAPPTSSGSTSVAGYTAAISKVQTWDSAMSVFDSSCTSSGIQLVTVTAKAPNGVSDSLNFVVVDPLFVAPALLAATIGVTNSTPTTIGSTVTYTATVTGPTNGPTPTAPITWTLGGPVAACASTTGPTGTTNIATYTCVITVTGPGSYSAIAAYPGDANYNAVTSTADSFNVSKYNATNVVTSTPTAPTLGASVKFTATVTGPAGDPPPTGTLTWLLTGGATTCLATTGPTGATNVVTYTCTITASKAGTYNATAVYPGDTNYNAVTSAVYSFSVAKATPTNSVAHSTPTTLGSTVTYTATVTGPAGGATPAGMVMWTLTGPVTACASTTGPTGATNVATYTCTITASKAGSYGATAAFAADANYNAKTSNTDSFTVVKANLTSNVVSHLPAAPTTNQSVTFTATVTAPVGGATPAGVVTWTLGGPVATCASTTGPNGTTNVATYTCTITTTGTVGTYTAKAAIATDANYNAATSNTDSFTS